MLNKIMNLKIITTLIFTLFICTNARSYLQKGIGEPCKNRTFWSQVKLRPVEINNAKYYNNLPQPLFNVTNYLEYNKTGVRVNANYMMESRFRNRLDSLIFAECVSYDGTYLNKIEEYLNGLCQQPSWIYTNYDASNNYSYLKGVYYFVEILSAEIAADLGQAVFMLDQKLKPATIKKIQDVVNLRVFEPMRKSFKGETVFFQEYWLRTGTNINAICLSGVLVAALTLITDSTERYNFVDKLLTYQANYLAAFTSDFVYGEGVHYFNYGFSDYIITRQILLETTNAQLDIFNSYRVARCAYFCLEFTMSKSSVAHFGDDYFDGLFDAGIIDYVMSTFNSKLSTNYNNSFIFSWFLGKSIGYSLAYSSKYKYRIAGSMPIEYGMNKYYNVSGVMISRPSDTPTSSGLAATIKLFGGEPTGSHNHADAGSYSISLNGVVIVGDVGGPNIYSKSTFDNTRFNYSVINSFGHPVPFINGKKQTPYWTLQNKPRVLSQSTSSSSDKIVYDLRNVYNQVPQLNALTRTLIYNRSPEQNVLIEDEASFSADSLFEVAIVTKGVWKPGYESINLPAIQVNGRIVFRSQSINVRIEASDFINLETRFISDFANNFTRIGIKFVNKLSYFKLSVLYKNASSNSQITSSACNSKHFFNLNFFIILVLNIF